MAESESDKDATKTQRVMVQTYDDGYRAGYEAGRAQAAERLRGMRPRLSGPDYEAASPQERAAMGELARTLECCANYILAMEPRDDA